jgi:hypothetical protein
MYFQGGCIKRITPKTILLGADGLLEPRLIIALFSHTGALRTMSRIKFLETDLL